jgi:hypothetical protein
MELMVIPYYGLIIKRNEAISNKYHCTFILAEVSIWFFCRYFHQQIGLGFGSSWTLNIEHLLLTFA